MTTVFNEMSEAERAIQARIEDPNVSKKERQTLEDVLHLYRNLKTVDNTPKTPSPVVNGKRHASGVKSVKATNALSILDPAIHSAVAFREWEKCDAPQLIEDLKKQMNTITSGDMSEPGAMLWAQATTLNLLFQKLAALAKTGSIRELIEFRISNGYEVSLESLYLKHLEGVVISIIYTKLNNIILQPALKMQSQCVRTIEALNNIVNPRPVVHQQNNALVQQVNNKGQDFISRFMSEVEL